MRVRTAGWWPPSGLTRLGTASSRGGARMAALAVVLAAAGMTAGSAAAVGQQAASLRLAYSCGFPSGSRQVSVQITATLPPTGTAGQPIQPTGAGITIVLPHGALDAPGQPRAATVTLTAALSTTVIEGSRSAAATWGHFVSTPTAVPGTGSLRLTTTGSAPSVTSAAAGKVTVTAGRLSLLFATRTAGNPPASPPATPVTCVPRAGQDTTLGSIAVTGPARPRVAGSAPARASASPADNPAKCLPFPKNLKLNPRFPLPPPLPGSSVFHSPLNGCAYATGFTNAQKLHEAALVGPGLTDLVVGQTTYAKFPTKGSPITYIQIREPGQLEYHGRAELPPARATLLGFGFMPVSATLQISEIGTLNADLITCAPVPKCPNPPPKNVALFFARVSLNISDVAVNGVPLNVGSHCQTSPFTLKLEGVPPAYNIAQQFGVLTGTVTVPPFKGCADGAENLDPIFTASVSGPGNFVKITQAPLCTPTVTGQPGCPPAKPKPVH